MNSYLKKYLLPIILLLFVSQQATGQISPGELSAPHAQLEGMSNCTQCHDLGKKVSNDKCLNCHKEIKALVRKKRGYHANTVVRKKDCFDCHSEHHGRKFKMIHFDDKGFGHKLTGYNLEGKHNRIDCKKCHTPENIADPKIRKRIKTYLGLDDKCLSCHDDYHQKTLSKDCKKCHNFEAFKPAKKFDHDKAKYKLTGKHVDVDCVKCHKEEQRNGKDFQVFTGLKFNDCVACHEDPHEKRIKGDCKQCHVEESFKTFSGRKKFNHNKRTKFKLRGKHKRVRCFECHKRSHDAKRVFNDRKGVRENQCAVCHEDKHEGKFGDDCAKCHKVSSFTDLKSMDFFDHSVTDYALEGKHIDVDCKKCHKTKFTDPIDFSACKNCHEDYHKGELAKNGVSPDCVECHSLKEGFDYSLYTLEQHLQTDFPLEGSHLATPCFACHISEDDDRWKFKNIGSRCVDCHDNIHKDYMSEKYYPEENCEACHTTEAWAAIEFDHDKTDWKLEGKHKNVACRDCHFDDEASHGAGATPAQVFKGLKQECFDCHDNVHDDQFAENGVTDCKRCHVPTGWKPENFDHSTTKFPLEGAHADVACAECHKPTLKDGKKFTDYKIKKFECIDCHQ